MTSWSLPQRSGVARLQVAAGRAEPASAALGAASSASCRGLGQGAFAACTQQLPGAPKPDGLHAEETGRSRLQIINRMVIITKYGSATLIHGRTDLPPVGSGLQVEP